MGGISMREALTRLYALGPGRMQPGRERLRRLLAQAGNPHLAVPAVLVGGTNGKGRLVTALSALLSQRYRTAAFIKPHLKTIRERWRIDDQPVAEEAFVAAAHRCCDLIEAHHEPISFFEANILLGALLFVEAQCEVAIWEIGLGGREDACNLVEPLVSALTNVGYDHQAILGADLATIARDKAMICRNNRPLLLGPPRPGWEDAYAEYALAVREVSRQQGARPVELPPTNPAKWEAYFAAAGVGLPPDSRELLDAALDELAGESRGSLALTAAQCETGLASVNYRARMEQGTLKGAPVLLDAAHNIDSLRWLARMLLALTGEPLTAGSPAAAPRYPVVFGCQATRDPAELLAPLKPLTDVLVPIEIPLLRPCPLMRIISAAQELNIPLSLPPELAPNDVPAEYEIGNITELDPPDNRTNWIECVEHGLSLATAERPAVICGSIYYLGEILRVFEN